MNSIPFVFCLIPIASVVALGMAWFFFRSMMKEDEGTERMKEIAMHVRKGAMAYLPVLRTHDGCCRQGSGLDGSGGSSPVP